MTTERGSVKCSGCGRFISYHELERGASLRYEPDSDCGSEVMEWTCLKCVSKETERARCSS